MVCVIYSIKLQTCLLQAFGVERVQSTSTLSCYSGISHLLCKQLQTKSRGIKNEAKAKHETHYLVSLTLNVGLLDETKLYKLEMH